MASKTIKVFTDAEAHDYILPLYEAWKAAKAELEKLKADGASAADIDAATARLADARRALKNVMTIRVKTDPKTKKPIEYQGTTFMTITFNINGSTNDGWFSITQDIPLAKGIADPADANDKRNRFAGTRLNLEMKFSEAGKFGRLIDMFNTIWLMWVDDLIAEKVIVRGSRKIHELMQYRYGEDHPEHPNEPLADPAIRLRIESNNFSPKYKHKFLAGKPKTVFLDYTTAEIAPNGAVVYREAVVDGTPVTVNNMHKFIINGSVLKAGSRIMMPSASRSQLWISLPISINKMIIERHPEVVGFSDDPPAPIEEVIAAAAAPSEPAVPAEPIQPDILDSTMSQI